MTECGLPVARPLDASDEAGCSGKIWDDFFEVIIADPATDEPLPVGTVGEILVRPKEPFCFMQGYNGMPERTVETWRNFWFHTGDAGRIDARGYLWYIDCLKDTIRRRGENISSYEVEAVLLDYPGIAEVAAVAVKADEGGEDEVLVCVVLEAGAERPAPTTLLDFCVERMPCRAAGTAIACRRRRPGLSPIRWPARSPVYCGICYVGRGGRRIGDPTPGGAPGRGRGSGHGRALVAGAGTAEHRDAGLRYWLNGA